MALSLQNKGREAIPEQNRLPDFSRRATFLSKAKGMLHAHMGWIWNPNSIRFNRQNGYVRDLYRDKDLGFIHLNYEQVQEERWIRSQR